ncbi:MAG: hypothetical protein ABI402_08385 [Ferruginibacter sp.]
MRHAFKSILFFSIIYLFSSCKNDNKDSIALLTILNHSLVTSSKTIEENNQTIYSSMTSKLSQESTMEKAKAWQPKALIIKSLSDNAYNYIEQLKKDLREQAGARIENQREIFDKDNSDAATIIFNKSGEELLKKLTEYKMLVLEIDPEIRNKFENTIPFDTTELNNELTFKNTYFKNATAISALSALSCFQNKIRNTENMLIYFCHNNIGSVKFIDIFPTLIVNQSSSIVKRNETITITAAIGIFSIEPGQAFLIAGNKIDRKPDGSAVYKFKAAKIAGKYAVPVKVDYRLPDGTNASQETTIMYEVAKNVND